MTLHRLAVVAVDLSYGSEVRSGACVAYGPRAADRAHVAEHEILGSGKGLSVASGEVEIGDSGGTLENASADTRRGGGARKIGRRGDAGEPY